MTDPANTLGHLPDPDKRYQVMTFNRDAFMFVEILDTETITGMIVDLVSAPGMRGIGGSPLASSESAGCPLRCDIRIAVLWRPV